MDRSHGLILAALLLWTGAVYAPLRAAPYVYEDPHYTQQTGAIPWAVPGRALTVWSLRLTSDPGAAHLGNLAIHLANGVVLAAVATALVGSTAAVVATGGFLLLPLHSEAVSYVAARGDLLLTLWVLVALWGALQAIDGGRGWGLAVCVLAVGCATVSKEIGVVGIPLVLLTVRLWRPQQPIARLLSAGLLFVAGVLVGVTWERIASWVDPHQSWIAFAGTQSVALWELVRLALWPVGLSVDHDPAAIGPIGQIAALVALIGAVACVAGCWRRLPLVAWAVGWALLAVAPRFVLGSSEYVKEYQVYPAGIGLCVGLGVVVAAWLTVPEGEAGYV